MIAVRLDSVSKRYSRSAVGVESLTLDIPAGEHCMIVGPSGAGKSTLLRLLAGLESADSGTITFDGVDVTRTPAARRGVALVAQRPVLYPHLNVARNLAVGVELRQARRGWLWRPPAGVEGVSDEELRGRVADAADRLGLGHLLDRRPHELSGGEGQRVALGRALVTRAGLWLWDEPFAHLDAALRSEVRARTLLLREAGRPTIVEVTHDPAEALTQGGQVAVLRAGRLVQTAAPRDVYHSPRNRDAAVALGQPPINLVDGVVSGGFVRVALGFRLAVPLADGTRVTLGVRTEDVRVSPGGGWRVRGVEAFGPAALVTAEAGGVVWRAWCPPPGPADDFVEFQPDPARLLWFDSATGDRIEFLVPGE